MSAAPVDPARYPIGTAVPVPPDVSAATITALIDRIAAAPAALRAAVEGLDDAQLDTPYREGGWTVRQVVHHVPDSHMHAYLRMKKALAEDRPAITAYEEARWAELPDAQLPVEPSLALLERLHERWVALLRTLGPAQWERTYRHPEMGEVAVRTAIGLYAWHGEHHVAQVRRGALSVPPAAAVVPPGLSHPSH